jgi:hypothetical protein
MEAKAPNFKLTVILCFALEHGADRRIGAFAALTPTPEEPRLFQIDLERVRKIQNPYL